MTVRANSNSKFLFKFLLIAIVLIGFGGWALYDSVVSAPKKMKKAKEYWVESEEGEKEPWVKRHSGEEWAAIVEKKGWGIGEPKTPSGALGYAYFNYAMLLCIPLGAFSLFKYLQANKTWIEGTDSNFQTSGGIKFDFDQIKAIDKKKWAKKGLASITFSDGNQDRLYVLDDLKYEREPTDEILYKMEQALKDEQIVNGERERSPQEVAEEKRKAVEAKKQLENIDE